MYKHIVMGAGFAESATAGVLVYSCEYFGNPGYATMKEAITDLALDLYSKYYDDVLSVYQRRYSGGLKDCCLKTIVGSKTAKFCSECGGKITDKKFDTEEFESYIQDLSTSTIDSYGDAENTSTRDLTWWPYDVADLIGAPKEEVIYIAEHAQAILCAALLDAKPELRPEYWDDDDFSIEDWKLFKNEVQPSYR